MGLNLKTLIDPREEQARNRAAPYNPSIQLAPNVLEDTLNASDILLCVRSQSEQTELLVVREKTGRGRVWLMYRDINLEHRYAPRHAVHLDVERAEHAIDAIQTVCGSQKSEAVIGLSGMFFKVRDAMKVCAALFKWVEEEKSRPKAEV